MTDGIIDSTVIFNDADLAPVTVYPPLFGSTDAELAAGAAIRNYCGWHIAPAVTEVMVVDGSGSGSLILPTLRLNAVIDVTEDGSLVDATAVQWSQAGYLRKYCWTSKLRGVAVTVNHGYATTPLDLSALITRLAALGIGGRSGTVSVGQVSVTSSAVESAGVLALDDFSLRTLARYRRPGV